MGGIKRKEPASRKDSKRCITFADDNTVQETKTGQSGELQILDDDDENENNTNLQVETITACALGKTSAQDVVDVSEQASFWLFFAS